MLQAPAKTSLSNLLFPALLAVALFTTGLLIGRHADAVWTTVRQATIESYQNRYRVMSESGLDSIIYYVSTKDSSALFSMAEGSGTILDVADTPIKDLYDVRINYATRVETVKSLRALSNIDAVITVPLICH